MFFFLKYILSIKAIFLRVIVLLEKYLISKFLSLKEILVQKKDGQYLCLLLFRTLWNLLL